jgi:hypothetical protein
MWREFITTLGLFGSISLLSYKYYKFYKTKVNNNIRFLVSRDIPLKNVLDNEQIILELGVSGYGSFLKIRDVNENIKSLVKVKNVKENKENKEISLEYTFDDDSKLTFRKNCDTKRTLCFYENDAQMICHEDISSFINNYKTMCFNTEFDLLSELSL